MTYGDPKPSTLLPSLYDIAKEGEPLGFISDIPRRDCRTKGCQRPSDTYEHEVQTLFRDAEMSQYIVYQESARRSCRRVRQGIPVDPWLVRIHGVMWAL